MPTAITISISTCKATSRKQAFGKAHAGQTLTYQIRATDPHWVAQSWRISTRPQRQTLDPSSGYTYLPHYKQVWTITPDWFYAPDRDNSPLTLANNPGEILFDPTTGAPVPWTNNGLVERVPMAVKNINFLLKQDAPADNFDVNGTVYSDVNGNGKFDGTDAPAAGIYVYWDQNRNGVFDQGETRVLTDANGQYMLNIDLTTLALDSNRPIRRTKSALLSRTRIGSLPILARTASRRYLPGRVRRFKRLTSSCSRRAIRSQMAGSAWVLFKALCSMI